MGPMAGYMNVRDVSRVYVYALLCFHRISMHVDFVEGRWYLYQLRVRSLCDTLRQ